MSGVDNSAAVGVMSQGVAHARDGNGIDGEEGSAVTDNTTIKDNANGMGGDGTVAAGSAGNNSDNACWQEQNKTVEGGGGEKRCKHDNIHD